MSSWKGRGEDFAATWPTRTSLITGKLCLLKNGQPMMKCLSGPQYMQRFLVQQKLLLLDCKSDATEVHRSGSSGIGVVRRQGRSGLGTQVMSRSRWLLESCTVCCPGCGFTTKAWNNAHAGICLTHSAVLQRSALPVIHYGWEDKTGGQGAGAETVALGDERVEVSCCSWAVGALMSTACAAACAICCL